MAFGSRNSRRGSRPLLARWRHGAAAAPPLLGGDKKSSKRMAAVLHSVIQRLPLISHIVMLFLALYGPKQGQYYVAFVFFTLHIVLVSSQLRTAYGMIRSVAPTPPSTARSHTFGTNPQFFNPDAFTLSEHMLLLIGGTTMFNTPRRPLRPLSRPPTRLERSRT